jgi:uncharacterized protein YjbI with pentapeptide repeats
MMDEFLYIDKTFEKLVQFDARVANREFDGCVFKNCEFSNSVFSECTFIGCTFSNCNLSMAKLPQTALKTVTFKDCKLLGIRFDECEDFLFNVNFYDSALDYSWFNGKKMQKTIFGKCSLKGVNFSNCDLTDADFGQSNFDGAIFDNTNLKSADFSTAVNYRIDPEFNPMQNAKFSEYGVRGMLDKYDIRIE